MNDIALDIVGAASTGTKLRLIHLQQRAQDKTVALLEELRRELSASLIAGPGNGSPSELYYADRDGRFVMALRCFSVGKAYKDGAVFSCHKTAQVDISDAGLVNSTNIFVL